MSLIQRISSILNAFAVSNIIDSTPVEVKYNPYNDDGPCVLDKTYFTHLRRWVQDMTGGYVLSNHGGATLCFKVTKGNLIAGDSFQYWLIYTWAQCNLKTKDQFNRKIGRQVCLENFETNPKAFWYEGRTGLPTVRATRDYVIEQFMIEKSKHYSAVRQEYF